MNVASIYDQLSASQALSELLMGDYALSALIPAQENGIPALRAFLYAASPKEEICRPFAWLSLAWGSGALLRLSHCAAQDFMDPPRPLSERIAMALPVPLSVKEYLEESRRLAETLDVIEPFCFARQLAPEQKKALRDFDRLLRRLTPAGLMIYYQGLSPAFWAWLNDEAKEA